MKRRFQPFSCFCPTATIVLNEIHMYVISIKAVGDGINVLIVDILMQSFCHTNHCISFHFRSIYHSHLVSLYLCMRYCFKKKMWYCVFIDLNSIEWKCNLLLAADTCITCCLFLLLYFVFSTELAVHSQQSKSHFQSDLFQLYCVTQLYDFIAYLCVSKEICDILTIDTVNMWCWFVCLCVRACLCFSEMWF